MKIYKLNDINIGNRTEEDETTWMAKKLEAVLREGGCDAQEIGSSIT
jgi:hypothetical protein